MKSRCCLFNSRCKTSSRSDFTDSGTWPAADAAGVPGRREYLKENAWAKPTSSTRFECGQKILLALTRETNDKIRGKGKIGSGRAEAVGNLAVNVCRVSPVHRGEDAVCSALNGEMYERHQLRHVAMRRDEPIVDVSRMRGRVANPVEAGQFGQPAYESPKTPVFAIGTLPVIRIHVLAEKCDLAHPGSDGVTRLGQDLSHRS